MPGSLDGSQINELEKLECAFTVSNVPEGPEPKKAQKKSNEITSAIVSEVLGNPKVGNDRLKNRMKNKMGRTDLISNAKTKSQIPLKSQKKKKKKKKQNTESSHHTKVQSKPV